MNTPRLYVSAFEVDPALVEGNDAYATITLSDAGLFTPGPRSAAAPHGPVALPRLALETVRGLRGSGLDVVWFRDFWDYSFIEETIAKCEALLAITDDGYFSSTGKATELTYAAGQRAHRREPIPPIRVFVLPVDDSYARYRHMEKPGEWTVLTPEAGSATREIVAAMGLSRDAG